MELCSYLRGMMWPMEAVGLSSVPQGVVRLIGALRKNGNLLFENSCFGVSLQDNRSHIQFWLCEATIMN